MIESEAHVFAELSSYANLVTSGNYLLVLDTVIDDLDYSEERSWGPGDSPKSAVKRFLSNRNDFIYDYESQSKSLLSVAPEGMWRKL